MRIDLHTHSSVSDGTDTPREVMHQAAAAGLDVIALTDHDATAGWAQAVREVAATGVSLVHGAELSCSADGISVHLLSLLHDPNDPELQAQMQQARESREHRAQVMVERIAVDYPMTFRDVLDHAAHGATIGRPHIADAMVALGYVPDRAAAFARVLASDGPYYVRHYVQDVRAAVQRVRAAGGVPIIAHPRAVARGRVVADEVIAELAQIGLAGLEVDHRDHDTAARAHLRALAADLGLLVTGASDYHGQGKENRLGENTTDPEVLARILEQGRLEVVRPPRP